MSLLKINEEILALYELYQDQECREKLLEFIQKDLTEKMLSFWEKKERYETLKNLSNAYINDFLQFSNIFGMNFRPIPGELGCPQPIPHDVTPDKIGA